MRHFFSKLISTPEKSLYSFPAASSIQGVTVYNDSILFCADTGPAHILNGKTITILKKPTYCDPMDAYEDSDDEAPTFDRNEAEISALAAIDQHVALCYDGHQFIDLFTLSPALTLDSYFVDFTIFSMAFLNKDNLIAAGNKGKIVDINLETEATDAIFTGAERDTYASCDCHDPVIGFSTANIMRLFDIRSNSVVKTWAQFTHISALCLDESHLFFAHQGGVGKIDLRKPENPVASIVGEWVSFLDIQPTEICGVKGTNMLFRAPKSFDGPPRYYDTGSEITSFAIYRQSILIGGYNGALEPSIIRYSLP